MTAAEIIARLKAIPDGDWDQLEALAQRMVADARAAPSLLAQLSRSNQPELQAKAPLVLGHLEELSVLPWIDASQHQQGETRMQSLAKASSAYSSMVERCISSLKRSLDKREILPSPRLHGEVEERPPRVRECDAAYLVLRRWIYPGESSLKYEQNRSLYLQLDDEERDQEIAEYKKTGQWENFR
jgi:hypothetical protein